MVLVLAFTVPVVRAVTLVGIFCVTGRPVRPRAATGRDDLHRSATVANETSGRSKHLRAEHRESAKHENKTHEW